MNRRTAALALLAAGGLACSGCNASTETGSMKTPPQNPRGSRPPPKPVPPVVVDGVRYAPRAGQIDADGQVGGLLSAYDAAGKLLWTVKVYDNVRRPGLEGDVQDVFFRSLSVEPDGRLRIVDELGRSYRVDPRTRSVTADPVPPKSGRDGLLTAD